MFVGKWSLTVILAFGILARLEYRVQAAGSNRGQQPNFDSSLEPEEDFDDHDDVSAGSGSAKDSQGPPRRVFRLWPNGEVKYKFSPSLGAEEKAKLKASMNEIARKTCVKFAEAKGTDNSYVSILPGLKCSSMIGKQEGVSTLMLSVKKCFGNGTLARNLMRVLGFTYENNRFDRDNNIQINWDNISEVHKRKFTKLTAEDYPVTSLPYDFGSVTHYTSSAWAINKSIWTIRSKKNANQILGNNKGYSDGDIGKIRSLYNCR